LHEIHLIYLELTYTLNKIRERRGCCRNLSLHDNRGGFVLIFADFIKFQRFSAYFVLFKNNSFKKSPWRFVAFSQPRFQRALFSFQQVANTGAICSFWKDW